MGGATLTGGSGFGTEGAGMDGAATGAAGADAMTGAGGVGSALAAMTGNGGGLIAGIGGGGILATGAETSEEDGSSGCVTDWGVPAVEGISMRRIVPVGLFA